VRSAIIRVRGGPIRINEGHNGCQGRDCTVACMAQEIPRLDPATLRLRSEIAADAMTGYSKTEVSRQHVDFYWEVLNGEPAPEGGQ